MLRIFSNGILASFATAAALAGGATATQAAPVTACTAINLCYCINSDNKAAIDAGIVRIRQLLADQRGRGKLIGYLSIPLSPAGGGSFAINQRIAEQSKNDVEKRFGAQSVWMLNPGAEDRKRRRRPVHQLANGSTPSAAPA